MHITQAGALTKFVVAVMLTYLGINLLTVVADIQETQVVRDQLAVEVAAMEESNQRMEHALEYKDDPEMLERVARDKGYVRQGEMLYMDISGQRNS